MQTEQLLRGQIVAAALELFREKGYHSTTLMDIITAAKCSKGGFYHHFASKEDLLCCIHESFITYELEKRAAVRQSRGPAGDPLRPAWEPPQLIDPAHNRIKPAIPPQPYPRPPPDAARDRTPP